MIPASRQEEMADHYRCLVTRARKMAHTLESCGADLSAEIADRWCQELEEAWLHLFTRDERNGRAGR